MRLGMIFVPSIVAAAVGLGARPTYDVIHAWLWPTPEQVAAAQKAEAQHQAEKEEWVRQDTARRVADVDGNLRSRHPGCTFDDLGGYETPDRVRHPVFAIFCPAQTVAVTTSREVKTTTGKTTHITEVPETTSTDTPAEEQPQ